MQTRRQQLSITVLFVLFYLVYAVLHHVLSDASAAWQWIPLIPVIGMMACVVYMHFQQDEYIRRVLHLAYILAFWLIVLVLLMMSFIPAFERVVMQWLPLWSLPIAAWLCGYLFSLFHHR